MIYVITQIWICCASDFEEANFQPEIALFSTASFCKDPCVQNIQGVKQGFSVGVENDSE